MDDHSIYDNIIYCYCLSSWKFYIAMPLKAEGISFGICGYDKYKAFEMIRQDSLTKLDFGLMYALGIQSPTSCILFLH